MRKIIMAALAIASFGAASADAQSYYVRSVIPGVKAEAAQAAQPAQPPQTTCAPFIKDNWLMSGPFRVVNETRGISNEIAALAWCNSAKPYNMKGICIWQQNALSMVLEGATSAPSGQPGIGLHASTCS